MNPKEKAKKLFKDAYMRWCYELSHSKNIDIARNICEYICNEVLSIVSSEEEIEYWTQVKKEVYEIQEVV